jgi:hypothetical protein
MHHVDSEEMSLFWEFEAKTYLRRQAAAAASAEPGSREQTPPLPITLRDMYHEYFVPRATSRRDDWDNISVDIKFEESGSVGGRFKALGLEGWQKRAHESADGCRTACEKTAECFQYSFRRGACGLSRSFKIGYPTRPEADPSKRQTSGWLRERIEAWVESQGECAKPIWPEI